MAELKIHPIAAKFPALRPEEFAALVEDIKEQGQHHPIMLTPDGTTIADGINRYKACKAAGVEPKFKALPKSYDELDIIKYIISVNLQRRDLSPGARGILIQDIRIVFDQAAKERQLNGQKRGGPLGGRPRKTSAPTSAPRKSRKAKKNPKDRSGRANEQLARLARIGHTTAQQAKYVLEHSPSLAADVVAERITLNDAYKKLRRAEAAAQAELEAPSRIKTIGFTDTGKEVETFLPKSPVKFNATNDQVSWAVWTWNPVTGCKHNCKYCYAREGAEMNENLKPVYPAGFTPVFWPYRLDAPKNSRVPEEARTDPRFGRVFVTSMGDLFGKWVLDEWIEKVFAAAHRSPEWEYLFLTKFPQRYVGLKLPPTAWIGTTVDEQYRVKIAEEAFRKIGGVRVKWLSLEPLLEPLEFSDLSMFNFVVIGSQSATNQPDGYVPEFAPPIEWVMELTLQAKAAGCKVYHKPNLLGIPNPQCAGMKLMQEVPDLAPLPRSQGELKLTAAV